MTSVRTVRVLVVEDNPAYLYLIQKAFARPGEHTPWELQVAEDGEQALRFLFEGKSETAPLPDIILLDWNLPKVNGNEVLKRLKAHENLRKIPILIFSASDSESDIGMAYGNHANGYITKPDNPDYLGSVVSTIEEFWVKVASLSQVVR